MCLLETVVRNTDSLFRTHSVAAMRFKTISTVLRVGEAHFDLALPQPPRSSTAERPLTELHQLDAAENPKPLTKC